MRYLMNLIKTWDHLSLLKHAWRWINSGINRRVILFKCLSIRRAGLDLSTLFEMVKFGAFLEGILIIMFIMFITLYWQHVVVRIVYLVLLRSNPLGIILILDDYLTRNVGIFLQNGIKWIALGQSHGRIHLHWRQYLSILDQRYQLVLHDCIWIVVFVWKCWHRLVLFCWKVKTTFLCLMGQELSAVFSEDWILLDYKLRL